MSNQPTNIESVSVSVDRSSLLSDIKWERIQEGIDPKGNLTITFRSGGKSYEYSDVPLTVLQEMLTTKSVGKYFHSNIKDQYDTYLLTEV